MDDQPSVVKEKYPTLEEKLQLYLHYMVFLTSLGDKTPHFGKQNGERHLY
jgi:hypothetical protein